MEEKNDINHNDNYEKGCYYLYTDNFDKAINELSKSIDKNPIHLKYIIKEEKYF